MISSAARLTAQGSAAAVAVGATTGGGGGNEGAAVCAVAWAGEVTVGSGVLDTVESPEPHPATVTVAATMRTAHFTTPHRTGNATGRQTGAQQGNPLPNH